MYGGNFDWDFGNGWSLSDKLNFTGGQMNTISFFSTGANPTTLGSYISSQETADGLPAGLPATATYYQWPSGKPKPERHHARLVVRAQAYRGDQQRIPHQQGTV